LVFCEIDPNNVLPNIVKYHIVDPTVATTKVTYEKFMKNPIEKLTKNIKETYNSRDLGTLAGELHTHKLHKYLMLKHKFNI